MKNINHKMKSVLEKVGVLLPIFRMYEKVKAIKHKENNKTLDNGLPLPPAFLRVLVAGSPDAHWFLEIGKRGANSIENVLAKNDVDVKKFKRILDFGCGCGRVIRHFKYLADRGLEIIGCDYNRKLIDWNNQNLRFASFTNNQLNPPATFADSEFDLVYSLSVFTHLDKNLQIEWMREIYRIIKGGGYLIITTQGTHYRDKLNEEEKRSFDNGQIVVKYAETSGSNLCSAYHPLEYIKGEFSSGFELVDFIEKGALGNPFQDLVLFKKI